MTEINESPIIVANTTSVDPQDAVFFVSMAQSNIAANASIIASNPEIDHSKVKY